MSWTVPPSAIAIRNPEAPEPASANAEPSTATPSVAPIMRATLISDAALLELLLAGKLKYRESVLQGIESAPRGLVGLLKGDNFGKQLVKLA